MLTCYSHLYDNAEDLPNQDAAEEFLKHLIPAHRKFYDSLSEDEQLLVDYSMDPFDALRIIRNMKRGKR